MSPLTSALIVLLGALTVAFFTQLQPVLSPTGKAVTLGVLGTLIVVIFVLIVFSVLRGDGKA